MTPEQIQYACDLVNQDVRSDGGAPVCKVGRLCNGRCIPQNHKCGGLKSGSGQHSEHDPEHDPAGSNNAYHKKTNQMIALRRGIAFAAGAGAGSLLVAKAMEKPAQRQLSGGADPQTVEEPQQQTARRGSGVTPAIRKANQARTAKKKAQGGSTKRRTV